MNRRIYEGNEKSFSLELLIRKRRQNERYATKSFRVILLITRRKEYATMDLF